MAREFRTEASLQFERRARELIKPILEAHGFLDVEDNRRNFGTAISQTIFAKDLIGRGFGFRVRLCWRRDGRNPNEDLYSAAQLRARLIEGGFEATVSQVARTAMDDRATHMLFVQVAGDDVVHALALPLDDLLEVWVRQRQKSAELIAGGHSGRLTKNHAENGNSPTIYIQDMRFPRAHEVSDIIWDWPTALNTLALPRSVDLTLKRSVFDDLYEIGSDTPERHQTFSDRWLRDPKVRAAVRDRARGKCERQGCGEGRPFDSFLDVHHILGANESDRVWTCVALCPNCHREAHFSPDKDSLNSELLSFARKFAPNPH